MVATRLRVLVFALGATNLVGASSACGNDSDSTAHSTESSEFKLAAALPRVVEPASNKPSLAASITVESIDAAGRSFPADFRILDSNWNPVSSHSGQESRVVLEPGTYVVEPSFDPLQSREIDVVAGENDKPECHD